MRMQNIIIVCLSAESVMERQFLQQKEAHMTLVKNLFEVMWQEVIKILHSGFHAMRKMILCLSLSSDRPDELLYFVP